MRGEREKRVIIHGFVGAGFLAATFLVRPFLPSEEEADKDILCNRFVIMVLEIHRGPACSEFIFLLHLSFSLSCGLLFKQIFTIVIKEKVFQQEHGSMASRPFWKLEQNDRRRTIQPTNRQTNRPSYRRARGLIGVNYTSSIKSSCLPFSFRLTRII